MRSIQRFLLLPGAIALCVGLALSPSAPAAPLDDAQQLRKRCEAFVAAWNAHDPKALTATFAIDADLIDASGVRTAGRDAIQQSYAEQHGADGAMRSSTVEVKDEPIRFVTPEVAISDSSVIVTGVLDNDGEKQAELRMHITNVWRKSNGEWWVIASRPVARPTEPQREAAGR